MQAGIGLSQFRQNKMDIFSLLKMTEDPPQYLSEGYYFQKSAGAKLSWSAILTDSFFPRYWPTGINGAGLDAANGTVNCHRYSATSQYPFLLAPWRTIFFSAFRSARILCT